MSYSDETAFDCGDPPQFCTWKHCEKKCAQIRVDVSHNGTVFRKIASDVMDRNHKLAGAYMWVGWVGRCDLHYDIEQSAVAPDWREKVMQEFWALQPEFAVVPADEQERRDILTMHKHFNRGQSEAAARSRQAIEDTKRKLRQQEMDRERELLPHEHQEPA